MEYVEPESSTTVKDTATENAFNQFENQVDVAYTKATSFLSSWYNKIAQDPNVQQVSAKIDEGMKQVSSKLDEQYKDVSSKLDIQYKDVSSKIDAQVQQVSAKINELSQDERVKSTLEKLKQTQQESVAKIQSNFNELESKFGGVAYINSILGNEQEIDVSIFKKDNVPAELIGTPEDWENLLKNAKMKEAFTDSGLNKGEFYSIWFKETHKEPETKPETKKVSEPATKPVSQPVEEEDDEDWE